MVDPSRSRSSWDDPEPRDWREDREDRSDRSKVAGGDGPSRRGYRRSEPRIEQRLDQWMAAGRQLVDGVAGARPGSRPGTRSAPSRAGSPLRLDHLGRWVEDRLDWLLEDDDGWRDPWQEGSPARQERPQRPVPESDPWSPAPRSMEARAASPAQQPSAEPAASSRRRPLEAVSRRTAPLLPPPSMEQPVEQPVEQQDWPDDASFSLNRWRRDAGGDLPARGSVAPSEPTSPAARAVPRSSRRRSG